MTISAPHDGKAPLSRGVAAFSDETMEEVATPLDGAAHSEGSRTVATEIAPFGQVSAPLDAPHDSVSNQVEYHKYWRNGPGKERFVASVKRWQQRNPEKRRAHYDVDNALGRGDLVRGPCERAGDDCKGRIEAHHDDYSKTLEVRWFCKRHHKQADRERQSREVSPESSPVGSHDLSALAALALGARSWE